MRFIPMLVLSGLLLTASCNGALRQEQQDCEVPKVGQVLAACAGTIVISLGSGDGMRPGESLTVLRGGNRVTGIILHEVKDTQSVGTAIGGGSTGEVLPGDTVVLD